MSCYSISTLSNGHSDSVLTLAHSNRLLASGSDDGSLCLWSPTESNSPTLKVTLPDPCSAVKFSINNSNLLYSAHNCSIYSWDPRCLENPLKIWTMNEDEINCFDMLVGEPYLAACDDSGAVQIISTDTGNIERSLTTHKCICSAMCFRPNKPRQLVSGGLDCRVIVSDWRTSDVAIFEMGELINNNLTSEMANLLNSGQTGLVEGEEENQSEASEYETDEYETDDDDDDDDGVDKKVESTDDIDRQDNNNIGAEEIVVERKCRYHPSSLMTADGGPVANASTLGLPINPPMVHAVACTNSGSVIAVGLESNTVELFSGEGKELKPVESLYGHRRGVTSLLFIGEKYLVSGGNDSCLFVWPLSADGGSTQFNFGSKVDALEGTDLSRIYVADSSSDIHVMDLSIG